MKIVTVVGARPQFVKAAAVSRELRKEHQEILVHTGQHYDENMSSLFFEELNIPKPDYNLGVGSKSHARQTAEIMIGIEDVLLKEKPEAVLIYGDTNSTGAAAIASGKLDIPIAHVEAGLRTFIRDMPEEQNRIIADHLSTWNFVPSELGLKCLKEEGLEKSAYFVGDVMYDTLLYYSKIAEKNTKEYYLKKLIPLVGSCNEITNKWYLSTIHRPENTDDPEKFDAILQAFEVLDYPVIFPVHPRTKKLVYEAVKKNNYRNIYFVEPLGYIEMIYFAKNSVKIITDSGGLQKEAFLMKVPGIVLLRNTGWTETLEGNCNVLAHPDKTDILEKVFNTKIDFSCFNRSYYGDGKASQKITEILSRG